MSTMTKALAYLRSSNQPRSAGEVGRFVWGSPGDDLSRWGRCGGQLLHQMKDAGLARPVERIGDTRFWSAAPHAAEMVGGEA